MTDAEKRLLTEYLGECWHESVSPFCGAGIVAVTCIKCKELFYYNRLFTDWPDYGKIIDRIKERGAWRSFWDFALYEWGENDMTPISYCLFTEWLFSPARIYDTVLPWLKSKEGKK